MSDIAVAESGTRLQNFLDRAGLRGFPWKTAAILYTISWGWLFIVRDSYWVDDWDQFAFRSLPFYDGYGYPHWADLGVAIYESFGSGFVRLLIFVLFFIVAVFLFAISEKFSLLDVSQRTILVLMFLLLPFNSARLTLMVFHYSVAYFLFFFAWYLLVVLNTVRSKLAACVLFFLSFQMFALLVFFLLPICHLYFLEGRSKVREGIDWARKNLIFITLPVIYWVFRALLWPASREYHSMSDNKLIGFIKFMLMFIFLMCLLMLIFYRSEKYRKSSTLLIIIGVWSMFLGYAPHVLYGLVGNGFNVPLNFMVVMLGRSDWYSRHQTLQPLGFSILLVGLIGLLPSFANRLRPWFVGAVLVISVVFNVGFGFEYLVDYSKQTSIVAALAAKPNRTAGDEIQIVDQTKFLNARQRSYRERDWLGLVGLGEGIESMKKLKVVGGCSENPQTRLVLIQGPETHWKALKNWVSGGEMGFEVIVDDTPGACKPEMVTNQQSTRAIPILFYFTGAKD
jgi:hypothetical protein